MTQSKKMPVVVVEKAGDSPAAAIRRLLAKVAVPDLSGKTVLLKPNMGRIVPNDSGIVTSRAVIFAVIEYFLAAGAGKLILGDSPIIGVKSREAFARAGIVPADMPAGAVLLDLDGEKPVKMKIPKGRLINELKVCAQVMKADYIVSLPVMKTHMHTVVSLGIKNMKGCLYRKEKVKLHKLEAGKGMKDKTLDVAIADMASALRPDLTIVDGTVGMEGFGPSSGETVKPGLLVAGTEPVAVDAVTARLMGFDPREIPSLRLCCERGLGEIDENKIEVIPAGWRDWITPFKPAPFSVDIRFEGVFVYDNGACSGCTSTILLFLKRYETELRGLFGKEDIHIYVGEKNKVVPRQNAIFVGNCTGKSRNQGLFIPGCPPVASYILEQLRKKKRGDA